jgi:hypothetical protein
MLSGESMKGLATIATVVCATLLAATTPHEHAPPNVFQGAGVFVDNTGNFPGPWRLAQALEDAHFSWVALHVHNGLREIGIDPLWVSTLRDHGLYVGAWGTEEGHPLIDAVLADLAIRANGFDFYIADAEGPYQRTWGGGWRSKVFANVFRDLQPTIPAALTTYGAAREPWVLPIDYASWRNAGFDLLPQAYYNQFPRVYRPDKTVAHSLKVGWPLERVHPVIGVYRKYPASRYVPLLQQAGATGFSVFLADQATAEDYMALSELIAVPEPTE